MEVREGCEGLPVIVAGGGSLLAAAGSYIERVDAGFWVVSESKLKRCAWAPCETRKEIIVLISVS
jgi:hypothetical protein